MTDRELLELAAKAAGIEPHELHDTIGDHGGIEEFGWNPLESDGDALRLAVKLGMDVYIDNHQDGCDCVEVESHTHKAGRVILNIDFDPNAATRRAIVRAAAEIGKKL